MKTAILNLIKHGKMDYSLAPVKYTAQHTPTNTHLVVEAVPKIVDDEVHHITFRVKLFTGVTHTDNLNPSYYTAMIPGHEMLVTDSKGNVGEYWNILNETVYGHTINAGMYDMGPHAQIAYDIYQACRARHIRDVEAEVFDGMHLSKTNELLRQFDAVSQSVDNENIGR